MLQPKSKWIPIKASLFFISMFTAFVLLLSASFVQAQQTAQEEEAGRIAEAVTSAAVNEFRA